jgi:hypothetical protein
MVFTEVMDLMCAETGVELTRQEETPVPVVAGTGVSGGSGGLGTVEVAGDPGQRPDVRDPGFHAAFKFLGNAAHAHDDLDGVQQGQGDSEVVAVREGAGGACFAGAVGDDGFAEQLMQDGVGDVLRRGRVLGLAGE